MSRTQINITILTNKSIESYPFSVIDFCNEQKIKLPSLTSKRGKALAAMLNHPQHYWTRDDCNEFCKRFQIDSKDTIQLFNKHEQWGLSQSKER